MSGNISTFDSKNPSFVSSMQISTELGNEVFENESLGISEHHAKTFSNKNYNFIENEEVFAEFKKSLAFESS